MATKFKPSDLVKARKEEESETPEQERRESPAKERREREMGVEKHNPGHSAAHPGFKAVEKKIGERPGIRNPGAVLAAASRHASPAAKAANPRLNRVKG